MTIPVASESRVRQCAHLAGHARGYRMSEQTKNGGCWQRPGRGITRQLPQPFVPPLAADRSTNCVRGRAPCRLFSGVDSPGMGLEVSPLPNSTLPCQVAAASRMTHNRRRWSCNREPLLWCPRSFKQFVRRQQERLGGRETGPLAGLEVHDKIECPSAARSRNVEGLQRTLGPTAISAGRGGKPQANGRQSSRTR